MLDQKEIIDKTIFRLEQSAIVPFQDISPCLAVIYNFDNSADVSYFKSLKIAATKHHARIYPKHCRDIFEVSAAINEFKQNPDINGIIVISEYGQATRSLYNMIPARLDIDGLSTLSLGKLYGSTSPIAYRHAPCTPVACMKILQEVAHETNGAYDIAGLRTLIIGRSLRVGRPLAELLLQQNCVPTIVHSKVGNFKKEIVDNDVIICATGHPDTITVEDIENPTDKVFIDVGINVQKDGSIVGDMPSLNDFMNCGYFQEEDMPIYISPVPGGVGKVTTTVLFAKLFANKVAFIGDVNE